MSEDLLDKMVSQAVDKIIKRYGTDEFYSELGEPYFSALKSMVSDGIKVGIALAEKIREELK